MLVSIFLYCLHQSSIYYSPVCVLPNVCQTKTKCFCLQFTDKIFFKSTYRDINQTSPLIGLQRLKVNTKKLKIYEAGYEPNAKFHGVTNAPGVRKFKLYFSSQKGNKLFNFIFLDRFHYAQHASLLTSWFLSSDHQSLGIYQFHSKNTYFYKK